jgi:hypothetical protein
LPLCLRILRRWPIVTHTAHHRTAATTDRYIIRQRQAWASNIQDGVNAY